VARTSTFGGILHNRGCLEIDDEQTISCSTEMSAGCAEDLVHEVGAPG
jgi:hypothetical protein